jgi:hypothetical protein
MAGTHFKGPLFVDNGAPATAGSFACGVPYVLAQSGVPVVSLSSCTFDNTTGAFSSTATALPFTPTALGVVQVYMYASAGIPQAGLYYARFSSTTAGQLYTDAQGTIRPTDLTAGAYAGGTAAGVLAECTVPGGVLGRNGALRITAVYNGAGATATKTQRFLLGGTIFDSYGALAAGTTFFQKLVVLRNRGVETEQVGTGSTGGNSGSFTPVTGTLQYVSIDTRVDQVLQLVGFKSSAADCLVLEQWSVEIMPS